MSVRHSRKPRFKRAPQGGVRVTARDLAILRQVYRHRFLRSRQISALIGGSEQRILRRLNLLFHHGYLDRPWEQLELYQRLGSRPMVYALGNKGADLLADTDAIPRGKIDWGEKNRAFKQSFLQHTLAVAEVMVAFELSCRDHPSIRLLHAEEILAQAPETTQNAKNPLSWPVRVPTGNSRTQLGVVPDKLFGVHLTNLPEGQNRTYFFLEADRATMPVKRRSLQQSSVYRKFLAYYATYKEGVHTKRFNIKNFRVLTVTTSQARIANLIKAREEATGGKAAKLFLFTHREAIHEQNPLTLDWQTGEGEVKLVG